MGIKIDTIRITTCMGQVANCGYRPLDGHLTTEEQKEFDTIGYTGKNSAGVKTTFHEYLNSLNKGTWEVNRTGGNNGEFRDEYLITHAYNCE